MSLYIISPKQHKKEVQRIWKRHHDCKRKKKLNESISVNAVTVNSVLQCSKYFSTIVCSADNTGHKTLVYALLYSQWNAEFIMIDTAEKLQTFEAPKTVTKPTLTGKITKTKIRYDSLITEGCSTKNSTNKTIELLLSLCT